MRLGSQAVTLRRRAVTGQDEYGNDVYGTVLVTVAGCSVQPRTSTEDTTGRVQVISGVMLFAPADPLITAADVVEFDGRRFEVDGDPGVWQSRNGSVTYQQVALRRVTG